MAPPQVWFSGSLSILGSDRKAKLLNRGRRLLAEARVQVTPLLHDVRDNGDDALFRHAKRAGLTLGRLFTEDWAWKKAVQGVPAKDRDLLDDLAHRLRKLHEAQRPEAGDVTIGGTRVSWTQVPVERAGVYVPAAPVSRASLLMAGAIPAKVAGVPEVIACTAPRADGTLDSFFMAAADAAEVDEVYLADGAPAIFALAHGTKTIPACNVVVGTGDVAVQAAKQLVQGPVGTDAINGPTEVAVLADASTDPEVAAWELVAHAEHDLNAVSVLVATGPVTLREVTAALEDLLPTLAGRATVEKMLIAHGALIHVDSLDDGIALLNEMAPERLAVLTSSPARDAAKVRAAGAVFLGPASPTALAEFAGLPRALPTNGAARYASPLSPRTFLRTLHHVEGSPGALAKAAGLATRLAEAEQMSAQAASLAARQHGKRKGKK